MALLGCPNFHEQLASPSEGAMRGRLIVPFSQHSGHRVASTFRVLQITYLRSCLLSSLLSSALPCLLGVSLCGAKVDLRLGVCLSLLHM
jgi:hypothetical protein